MAFTYVGDLSTDLDSVRFYIQDITDGSGPLPADANFADAALNGLITSEGNWQRATAAAFETLAAAWTRHVTFTADGLSLSRSDIADGYAEKAALWRKRWGSASGQIGTLDREDEYTGTTTEYT